MVDEMKLNWNEIRTTLFVILGSIVGLSIGTWYFLILYEHFSFLLSVLLYFGPPMVLIFIVVRLFFKESKNDR